MILGRLSVPVARSPISAGRSTLLIILMLCPIGCRATRRVPPQIPVQSRLSYEQPNARTVNPSATATEAGKPESSATKKLVRISFAEVLDRALADNLDVALALAEQQISRQKALVSRAALLPSLEIGGGAAHTDGRVQGSFGALRDVDYDTLDPQVAITYRLNVGARISRKLAAERELDASVLRALDARQRLLLRVTRLYQNLVFSKAWLKVAEQVVADSQELVGIAAARVEAGVGLASEVARAKAKLASDRRQSVDAQRLWKTTSVWLAVALRMDERELLEPADGQLEPLGLTPSPDAWNAYDNASTRPDVEAARRVVLAASHKTSAARWDLFAPDLAAQLRQTYIGSRASNLNDRTDSGVFLLWSLSFDKSRRIKQRRAEEKAARFRLAIIQDKARGEVQASMQEIQAAKENIVLAKDEIQAAQTTVRLSRARFEAGRAMALEVIDAQKSLAQAQLSLIRSTVAFNLAQAKLLAAAGVIRRDVLLQAGPAATKEEK